MCKISGQSFKSTIHWFLFTLYSFRFTSTQSPCVTVITFSIIPYLKVKVKVKNTAIVVQAWTGPGGSRRFRLPNFMIIGT